MSELSTISLIDLTEFIQEIQNYFKTFYISFGNVMSGCGSTFSRSIDRDALTVKMVQGKKTN